jgi:hypothetical protein
MTKANLYDMFIKPLENGNVTLDQVSELLDPWTDYVCSILDEDNLPKSKRIFFYKRSMADMNDPNYNGETDKDTIAAFAYGLSLSLFKGKSND